MVNNLLSEIQSCTGKGVKVAVIDSGIREDSAAFKNVVTGVRIDYADGRIKYGRKFNDENGHGTKVCEIITSISPKVEMYVARIFKTRLAADLNCLVEAINWAISKNVKIINLSLGTTSTHNINRLKEECEKAARYGIFIISSLDNRNKIAYPGWFSNTLCVSKKYKQITRRKKFLLGVKTQTNIRILNSYLVPVVSALSALVVEKNNNLTNKELYDLLNKILNMGFVLGGIYEKAKF